MSVVAHPASAPYTRDVWSAMIEASATYRPFVRRLVGFLIFIDWENDDGRHLSQSDVVALIPEIAALTSDEQEFVWMGAMAVYFEWQPQGDADAAYDGWIKEGAYV